MAGEIMKIERGEYLALKKENSALKAENVKLKNELVRIKKQSDKTIKKGV